MNPRDPTKRNHYEYTDDDRETFLLLLDENNGNISKTCRQMNPPIAGLHDTVNGWRDRIPWFNAAMNRVVKTIFDDIEGNTFSRARTGDHFPSERFLLLNHPEGRKRGYIKRSELTGADGNPLFGSFADLMNQTQDSPSIDPDQQEG